MGTRRSRLGLADVFGIEAAADVQGPNGNSYYARIEGPSRDSAEVSKHESAAGRQSIVLPVKAEWQADT